PCSLTHPALPSFPTRRSSDLGVGVISPLGNSAEKLWAGLSGGVSGVRELTAIPADAYPTHFGGEARDFTGSIDDFGPLEKAMSRDRKSTRLNSSHDQISYAVF